MIYVRINPTLDTSQTKQITSPNWPSNYDIKTNFSKAYSFDGAEAVQVTFDSASKTETHYDYISICNKNDIALYTLSGSTFYKDTYIVDGDYVCIKFYSNDDALTDIGFCANITPFYDEEEEPSKEEHCGENLNWILDEKGTLTINGTGTMYDYNRSTTPPWYAKKDLIISVVIDDNVTHIGNYAFYDCTNLTNVSISKNVTSIGNYAFLNCSRLKEISIPKNVTNIGKGAFTNCSQLEKIYLYINTYADTYFDDSYTKQYLDITEIKLNQETLNLHVDETYLLSASLLPADATYKTITWTSSNPKVATVEDGKVMALEEGTTLLTATCASCKAECTVTVQEEDNIVDSGECDNGLKWMVTNDGILKIKGNGAMSNYSSASQVPWYNDVSLIQSIIVKEGVTSIGDSAFINCSHVTSVTLPSTITKIGTSAFEGCTSLTSIQVPDGVKTISNFAFANCTNLANVNVPKGVKTIGKWVFQNCTNLRNLAIPDSVTTISGYAFYCCSALKDVYYSGSTSNWNSITIEDNNSYLTSATIHYNSNLVNEMKLEGYSVSLNGSIGVNFYMALSDEIVEDENTYMTFTCSSEQTNVMIKDASIINGYYVFTCPVSAKDLTSNIKAKLHTENSTEEYTYTVEEYANYLINHASNYTNQDISVAKAMLTYGKYTQDYFEYNTTNEPKTINELKNVDVSSYAYKLTDSNDSIDFVGARLILTSKPGLKLYFKSNADISCTNGTLSTEGKYKVITISDISNIYTFYEVTGTNFTLKYSIASYGNLALNGSNESLKNLIKSMVAYYNLF